MPIVVEFVRTPIQEIRCDALAFAAKNTGEISGGPAEALLRAAGPELVQAGREALAKTDRQVGAVGITRAFNLEELGVKWICHVVTNIKLDPEDTWCPRPERLGDGVFKALELIRDLGGTSIAFAAMGTGAGRVPPERAANFMLSGVQRFQRRFGSTDPKVVFSLPSYKVFQAFRRSLATLQQSAP